MTSGPRYTVPFPVEGNAAMAEMKRPSFKSLEIDTRQYIGTNADTKTLNYSTFIQHF